jgi:hypothetical protein
MNNCEELYLSITNGDVKESIVIATKFLLTSLNNINLLENTLINICSYIGSFISIYDVKKWIDLLNNTKTFLENEKFVIKDIYNVITKMCILCDIYNKNPTTKCGTMTLKTLKDKVTPVFQKATMKLSNNGLMRFSDIIPPNDNEYYHESIRIISVLIFYIKTVDDVSHDDGNKLTDISNMLRNVLDYILRTKFKFETKFNIMDSDNAWFIWGIFAILYNEQFIDDSYWLYKNNYKKKDKLKRIGLLWGSCIAIIYSHKKNISKGWNSREENVIKKIDDLSLSLYNDIRKNLINSGDIEDTFVTTKTSKELNDTDGIEHILNYYPQINNDLIYRPTISQSVHQTQKEENNSKFINYK